MHALLNNHKMTECATIFLPGATNFPNAKRKGKPVAVGLSECRLHEFVQTRIAPRRQLQIKTRTTILSFSLLTRARQHIYAFHEKG